MFWLEPKVMQRCPRGPVNVKMSSRRVSWADLVEKEEEERRQEARSKSGAPMAVKRKGMQRCSRGPVNVKMSSRRVSWADFLEEEEEQ